MTQNQTPDSQPNPGLEQLMRVKVIKALRELPGFEEFIREDPYIDQILRFEGGLEKYLAELLPVPETWSFLSAIYFYYLFWFFQSSEFGIAAVVAIIKRVEQLVTEGVKVDFKPVVDELKTIDKSVKDGFSEIHSDLKGTLTGFEPVMVAELGVLGATITTALTPIDIATTATAANTAAIETTLGVIEQTLTEQLAFIREALDELPGKIAEALREREDSLADKIAKEVNKTIVGESYFKWSSTSQFYPSMVFVFAELGAPQYPRRSQIKVRLTPLAEEFTEAMVAAYTARLNAQGRFSYEYGNFRCNYVSADKRFKTTIYTSSRAEAVRVLQAIHFVMDDEFQAANLSVTEGWRRAPLGKRELALGNNPAEQQNYLEVFSIQLVRVTIYLNGLKYPVDLLD